MAQIRTDKNDVDHTGLRYDFERAVTTLTPSDPVARRRGGKKGQGGAMVSEVDAELTVAQVDADGSKLWSGIGKTGVALHGTTRQSMES